LADLPSKLRRSTFEEFVRNRAQELVLEKKKALQEFAARLESVWRAQMLASMPERLTRCERAFTA